MNIRTGIDVPSRKMRVLTVSDLHQRRVHYDQLAAAVALHKPDVLGLVGDFLDGQFPEPRGVKIISDADAALMLAAQPCECVFVRGNHEDVDYPDFEAAWPATRKLHALHGSAVSFGPLTIIGFPCWTGVDAHYAAARPRLHSYETETWLTRLLRATGTAGKTLWLMHEPPHPMLASLRFWEPHWRDAVQQYNPLVVVSGHDHTTPLATGTWHAEIGKAVCINAGQRVYPRPGRLTYCLLDFEFSNTAPGLPTVFTFRRFD
jgi:Icc-related predicted phosphoesterase